MTMHTKADAFRALHNKGAPLILFNAWDAGSAAAVAKAGAAAIATGSWAIASTRGFSDGEKVDLETHLDVLRSIARAVDLPISVDLESGFSADAAGVGDTVRRSIEAGAIGCNLEDSDPADGNLRPVEKASARYQAARRAADKACPGFFINARTDVFFRTPPDTHDQAMLDEAVARARRYAAAGADGIFVPGLINLELIKKLVDAVPLPVNIMRLSCEPAIAELAKAGVARISHGPYPYLRAMEALEKEARDLI